MHAWASFAFAMSACDAAPSASTSPDCEAVVTTVRGTSSGGGGTVSLVLVIDSHIVTSTIDLATLESSLRTGLTRLVAGDWDGDGNRDMPWLEAVRLTVLDARGNEMLAMRSVPPARATSAVFEGGIAVSAGDDAWTAWFLETAEARVHQALVGLPSERPTPLAQAFAFLEAHPEIAAYRTTDGVGIVVITDRDEADAIALPLLDPFVAPALVLVGAVPESDLEPALHGNFEALLETRPFQEAHVPCEDGRDIGVYPRRHLEALQRAAASGWTTGLVSSCAPAIARTEILRVHPRRVPDGALSLCLPHALAPNDDGLVACSLRVTLPAFGPRRRCSDLGLAHLDTLASGDGERERCDVPQRPWRTLAAPSPGFYYDDFAPDLYARCGEAAPQALSTTASTSWPAGTEGEATCFSGSWACGFDLPDAGTSDADPR